MNAKELREQFYSHPDLAASGDRFTVKLDYLFSEQKRTSELASPVFVVELRDAKVEVLCRFWSGVENVLMRHGYIQNDGRYRPEEVKDGYPE